MLYPDQINVTHHVGYRQTSADACPIPVVPGTEQSEQVADTLVALRTSVEARTAGGSQSAPVSKTGKAADYAALVSEVHTVACEVLRACSFPTPGAKLVLRPCRRESWGTRSARAWYPLAC